MPLDKIVRTRDELDRLVNAEGGGPYYVYVLRKPDRAGDLLGTPFYVGIGQRGRLFAHEKEARDPRATGAKVEAIRSIWADGREVLRTIDSVHSVEPWGREEQLINEIGRLAEGAGPLTNAQIYAPSLTVDGVELRKYAAEYAQTGDLNAIPPKFKLRDVLLMAGPRQPTSPASVHGKIHAVASAYPGVTGEQLVRLLQKVDFSNNKSAYTQGGEVSVSWLTRYIEGAFFRNDRQFLQEFRS
jgi:hypothetical protein